MLADGAIFTRPLQTPFVALRIIDRGISRYWNREGVTSRRPTALPSLSNTTDPESPFLASQFDGSPMNTNSSDLRIFGLRAVATCASSLIWTSDLRWERTPAVGPVLVPVWGMPTGGPRTSRTAAQWLARHRGSTPFLSSAAARAVWQRLREETSGGVPGEARKSVKAT